MTAQNAESVVMRQVLDDAELSLRAGDQRRLFKVIFVWSQRRDHLLAGEETWEDQRIGPGQKTVTIVAPEEVSG